MGLYIFENNTLIIEETVCLDNITDKRVYLKFSIDNPKNIMISTIDGSISENIPYFDFRQSLNKTAQKIKMYLFMR